MNDDLLEQFRFEVFERMVEVNSGDEEDWYSLTLGWALGKGLEPTDAHDFARFVRYKTDMG
jgi:hypothetical protein